MGPTKITLCKILFILATVLILSSGSLNAKNTQQEFGSSNQTLAYSKSWLRLLYYKPDWLGNYKSEVSDPKFFISRRGKFSPLNELGKSIDFFFDKIDIEKISDKHPICKFPARFFWLNKALKLDQLNKLSRCTKLNEFLARTRGKTVSLIFSSYYVSNPSSAFGHTFLKINKEDGLELDLLNYGINYAATSTENFGLIYAFKGLFGLFRGDFTAIPYYYKVREYNDFESRDLWEYRLNLKPEDVFFLNLHVWELGNASSRYFFLNKNCSYWAIRVIEAIKPDLYLEKFFQSRFVVPIETVKSLLKTKGLVKTIKYRPSLRRQLVSVIKAKPKIDIKKFSNIVRQLNSGTVTAENLEAYPIDDLKTTLLLYDYKNAGDYIENESRLLKNKRPLLVAISKKQNSSVNLNVEPEITPHNSHPPRRISLGYKARSGNNVTTNHGVSLSYKQGLHDILDSSRGFSPLMSLNYFDLTFLYFDQKRELVGSGQKFELDSFRLIGIDAFMPITTLEQKYSWRLNAGYKSEQFFKEWNQRAGYLNFDIGLSKLILPNQRLLIYALFSNVTEFNGRFENSIRFGAAPILGLKYTLSKDCNLIFENKNLFMTTFKGSADYANQTTFAMQNYFEDVNSAISINASYLKSDRRSAFNLSTQFSYFY